MKKQEYLSIDLVVVNFYPFKNSVINSKNEKI